MSPPGCYGCCSVYGAREVASRAPCLTAQAGELGEVAVGLCGGTATAAAGLVGAALRRWDGSQRTQHWFRTLDSDRDDIEDLSFALY